MSANTHGVLLFGLTIICYRRFLHSKRQEQCDEEVTIVESTDETSSDSNNDGEMPYNGFRSFGRLDSFDRPTNYFIKNKYRPKNTNWEHFELSDDYNDHHEIDKGSREIVDRFDLTNNIDHSSFHKRQNQVSFYSESYSWSTDDEDEDCLSPLPSPPHPTPTNPSYHKRSSYNSQIMPSKLILIRHGQSEGNVQETLYETKPDNAMKLTKLGWDQARMAGIALRNSILPENETVHFIVSPYVRTMETFHGLCSAWCDPAEFDHIEDKDERMVAYYTRLKDLGLTWHEDPRIREQDFGNYQDPATIKKCKIERFKFGTFYYRFPHGESASDVFDRVSTFLDSLWRSFDLQHSQNFVLVTHGISIRVFLARYFRYTIDQFHMLANPRNCECIVLKHDGAGRLRLDKRCDLSVEKRKSKKDGDNGSICDDSDDEVMGYAFRKRLRVVPKEHLQLRTVRLSHEDT